MFSFSKHSQPIVNILKDSFEFYKLTFVKIAWIVAILSFFLSLLMFRRTTSGIQGVEELLTWKNIFLFIIMTGISSFFMAAILHHMYMLVREKKDKLADSFDLAKEKWPTVFGMAMIVAITIFVGFSALFIPGVFLMILLMFCFPLILFENKNIIESIQGSVQLVWGNWWRTFLVIIYPLGLIMLLSVLMSLETGIGNSFASLLASVMVGTLTIPWLSAVILVQYNDLKLRGFGK